MTLLLQLLALTVKTHTRVPFIQNVPINHYGKGKKSRKAVTLSLILAPRPPNTSSKEFMSHNAVESCSRWAVNVGIKSSQKCVAFWITDGAGLMWHERFATKWRESKLRTLCYSV